MAFSSFQLYNIRIPFMCEIELFNHLLRIIIINYLKPYSCVQIIYITVEYLINRITKVK